MAEHVDPTAAERAAAEAFLRGEPVEPGVRPLLDAAVEEFGWAETHYVRQAREEGETAQIWETTCWIVANAIARLARGAVGS